MDVNEIIDRYYPQDDELKDIYMTHARAVSDFALSLAQRHPELALDEQFVCHGDVFQHSILREEVKGLEYKSEVKTLVSYVLVLG